MTGVLPIRAQPGFPRSSRQASGTQSSLALGPYTGPAAGTFMFRRTGDGSSVLWSFPLRHGRPGRPVGLRTPVLRYRPLW